MVLSQTANNIAHILWQVFSKGR